MKPSKYYFIGGVSPVKQGHGGETIKNTLFIKYLQERQINVEIIDTSKGKKNLVYFILQIFKTLILPGNHSIILSAATRSAYRYIKLANVFNIFNKKILYFVIGGTITDRIERGEVKARDLKSVNTIYIESKAMRNYLKEVGIERVYYLPNFKPLEGKILHRQHSEDDPEFKLVFLSRIKVEKGVKILLEAFTALKKRGFNVSLDFFGPVEEGFKTEFQNLVAQTDGVFYKGFLDLVNDDVNSYKILSEYDLKIFPTFHYGEGFPGIFIDCFAAGVPVIASDWKFNSEILENGVSGYLTVAESIEDTSKKIQFLIEHPRILNTMKETCNRKAMDFDIGYLLDPIFCNNENRDDLEISQHYEQESFETNR